jgi:hypothetical protein
MGQLFDITDKCLAYIKESIEDMPGNEGQKVLVDNLEFDGYSIIDYERDGDDRSASCSFEWEIRSNHPEAIEQIIEYAYESAEVIAKQAETILDVFSPLEWIIAGWDG